MKTIRAYRRNNGGLLEIVDMLDDDGIVCDLAGYPLTRTSETTELRGWPDEGVARIYKTAGGPEVLVPEERIA